MTTLAPSPRTERRVFLRRSQKVRMSFSNVGQSPTISTTVPAGVSAVSTASLRTGCGQRMPVQSIRMDNTPCLPGRRGARTRRGRSCRPPARGRPRLPAPSERRQTSSATGCDRARALLHHRWTEARLVLRVLRLDEPVDLLGASRSHVRLAEGRLLEDPADAGEGLQVGAGGV